MGRTETLLGVIVIAAFAIITFISCRHDREEIKVRCAAVDTAVRQMRAIVRDKDPRSEANRGAFRALEELCYSLLPPHEVERLNNGQTLGQLYKTWV